MSKQKPKKKRSSPLERWIARWGILAIAIAASGLYIGTITHGFVLDDAILITENTFTQQGFAGLKDIFSNDTFRGFFKTEGKDQLVAGGRYRPLTHAMFAVEHALWGNRSWPGHLINVLCYALLCVTIFRVIFFLLRAAKYSDAAVIALATALLFAVHPVHVEVVANIKSRDEIVALLIALLSFYCWLQHLYKPSTRKFIISATLILVALLAKESVVTLLAVAPLAAVLLLKIPIRKALYQNLPLLLGFVGYLIIRVSVIGWGIGADPPLELLNNPFLVLEEGSYRLMTWTEKLPLIFLGLGKSMQLTLLPVILTHDYYPRYFPNASFAQIGVVLSFAATIALITLSWWARKKHPIVSYGVAWFLMTLSLTSNIFFPIGTHLAERFLFVPTVGYCLVIAYLFHGWHGRQPTSLLPKVIFVSVLILGIGRSVLRTPVWESNFRLFTTDVEYSGQSAKVRNAAGGELIARAETNAPEESRSDDLIQAITILNEAIEIYPHYQNAFLLRGNAQLYLEQYQDALNSYDQALTIDPTYRDAINNKAIAHRHYGKYLGEQRNNIDQALVHLQMAYESIPSDYETNRLLGVAYGNQGMHLKAMEFFEKAHEIEPRDVSVVRNLQAVYSILGQPEKSEYFRQLGEELDAK